MAATAAPAEPATYPPRPVPGPYSAVPNGGDDESPERRIIVAPNRYGDLTMIAQVDRGMENDHVGYVDDTACLLAAAWNLYTALSDIIGDDWISSNTFKHPKWQERARAALAKARAA